MQSGHCSDKGKAEPGAIYAGATLQSIKSLEDPTILVSRDPKPVIAHAANDFGIVTSEGHLDTRAGGCMANGIVHDVCDHFGKEFAVTPRMYSRLDSRCERLSFVLGQIAKRICDSPEQFRKINFAKTRLARSSFNLCDTQQS
jgi:hypothetical protein